MTTTRASVPPASDDEAREDLALAQLVLGAADDEKVAGPGLPGAGRGRHGAQHTQLRTARQRGARLDRMPAADAMQHRGSATTTRCSGPSRRPRPTQLRAAFREAVLRHHPDRAPVVRGRHAAHLDPQPRVGRAARPGAPPPLRPRPRERAAATLDWPLEPGRAPPRRPRGGRAARRVVEPSPWHQPQWRSVAGFRVPAEVFLAGPTAQERWIVEHHIVGEDWREHTERYWLRFAARYYAERGRTEDWLGALERMLEQDPPLAEIVDAGLRDAYLAAGEELRGAMVVAEIAERHPVGSPAAALGRPRAARPARGVPRQARPPRRRRPSGPRTPSCS